MFNIFAQKSGKIIKGALDKYNIYLFVLSNSLEDFKLNQYRKFQLILPMRVHFMRYFMNSVISRVSHIGYCIEYLLKSTSKKYKMLEIFVFLQK